MIYYIAASKERASLLNVPDNVPRGSWPAPSRYCVAPSLASSEEGALFSSAQVRASTIHGLGLFAASHIPEGTEVGRYPGYLRSPQEMIAKAQSAPGARDYCWLNGKGMYLDPTDCMGHLSSRPGPGVPWPFDVNVDMARVNEPPIGVATPNLVEPRDLCILQQ